MILYDFFRSGSSYRTRIALNIKGLSYNRVTLSLPKREHLLADHVGRHPQALVPVLETGDMTMIQSPAILEWLEETYPDPPLLPDTPLERQHVRAMAAIIGCDIHPINNLRVLNYLRAHAGMDEPSIARWCAAWISNGFAALEKMIDGPDFLFCYGSQPSLADCYLVPQIYSARRFGVDLTPFPNIVAVGEHCCTLEAFANAHPDRQPDAL